MILRRATRLLLTILCCSGSPHALLAQCGLQVEAGTFLPYNVPMPLSIRQSDQPELNVTARFASEPLKAPICWVWRVGWWSGNRVWELEAVHHKIYLQNPPPNVAYFSISHGLNLITINRGWQFEQVVVRIGGGIILAHPESSVRGKVFSEDGGFGGYELTGPTAQASLGRHFLLGGGFLATLEAKASGYLASVPVVDGDSHMGGLFFQLTLMLGWRSW